MKGFLGKSAAFLLLQCLLFALFWRPGMPHDHNYLAATIDKHRRLQATSSPRIILVGGSNLAFGIKSETLERELGRPVVNMGLNAGLGIRFMLDEIEQEIRPGDIVVLSFEYNIFSEPGVELISRQLLERRPASLTLVPKSEWKRLIDNYGFAILGGIVRRTLPHGLKIGPTERSDPYKRDLFDPRGSYTGHYGETFTNLHLADVKISEMSEPNRARIERFARTCRERDVACFYSCPPQPVPLLSPIPEGIEQNLAQLARIPNLVLLDSPRDHQYATDLFYDTTYHLTEQGADERTRKLIGELRPHVANNRFDRGIRTMHAMN